MANMRARTRTLNRLVLSALSAVLALAHSLPQSAGFDVASISRLLSPTRRFGPSSAGTRAGALGKNHSDGQSSDFHESRNTSSTSTSSPGQYTTPTWPPRFQIDFEEENYFFFYTLSTSGSYYYDYASNRMRIDRADGRGDPYCGSAMPGYDTPCTHLVIEDLRFLFFPEKKYCCKCCPAEMGCGVLRPDWLTNATYLGHDYIYGILTTKWNKPGLQNNYYWQAMDETPIRIYQEPTTQMTFHPTTYSKPASFDESLFTLPSDLDCSPQCYGVCGLP